MSHSRAEDEEHRRYLHYHRRYCMTNSVDAMHNRHQNSSVLHLSVCGRLLARMLVPIAVEVRLRVSGGSWKRLHHMTYIRKLFAPGVAVYKAALLRKDGYFGLQSASYLDGHREWPRKLNLWLLCLAEIRGVAGSNT